jgi:ribosomal-protein-alanine N-acetyltransferase
MASLVTTSEMSVGRPVQRVTCRTATPEIKTEPFRTTDWRAGLPQLVNDHVTLRELRRSDAAALQRIARCPDVARHTWPAPHDVEAFERFIEWTRAERAAGRYVCFGIVPDGATDASGLFELRQMQPGFFRGELGCIMDPALWGTGLFQAGARLLLEFAFGIVGVQRIEARTSVDNVRSNMAMSRLGARKEGVLRAAFVCDGKHVDQHLWAIVAGLDKCVGSSPWRPSSGPAPVLNHEGL